MVDLLQRIDLQEEEMVQSTHASQMMLQDLQAKLEERRNTITGLNGRSVIYQDPKMPGGQ